MTPASERASPTDRACNLAAGVAGAGLLVVAAIWVITSSVQQDFAAYYTAGQARALGLDPYVNHLGIVGGPWDGLATYRHSRFLYPPVLAELFRPLAALPFAWAKALFTGLSLVALAAAIGLTTAVPPRRLGVAVLAAALWPPVFLALERGQIDLLLLPVLGATWRLRDRRRMLAGVCLGICAVAKPSVLAVLPMAMLVMGGRALWWAGTSVACVAVFLGVGALLSGADLSRRYLGEVLPRAALHGEGGPAEWLLDDARLHDVANDLEDGIARVNGRGRGYAQGLGDFRRNASLARWLSGGEAPPAALSLGILAALGGTLAVAGRRRRDGPGWFWGALTVGLLAAPVSWAMSLTWALPLLLSWRPASSFGRSSAGRAFSLAAAAMFALGFLGLATPVGWVLAGIAAIAAASSFPGPERARPSPLAPPFEEAAP